VILEHLSANDEEKELADIMVDVFGEHEFWISGNGQTANSRTSIAALLWLSRGW